jgi:hypothetical protein
MEIDAGAIMTLLPSQDMENKNVKEQEPMTRIISTRM